MLLEDRDIDCLTKEIWSSMLGLELHSSCVESEPAPAQNRLTGCVHLTGAWYGTVLVQCSAAMARRVTSIMFGLDSAPPEQELISDALGEVTNIAGGNIKKLIPGICQISSPMVLEGGDYNIRTPGSRAIKEVKFECEGERVAVIVLERQGAKSSE